MTPTMADVVAGLQAWQESDPDRHRLGWRALHRSIAATASTPDAGPVFLTFLTPTSGIKARNIVRHNLKHGPARSLVVDGDVIDATPDGDLAESIQLIDAGD